MFIGPSAPPPASLPPSAVMPAYIAHLPDGSTQQFRADALTVLPTGHLAAVIWLERRDRVVAIFPAGSWAAVLPKAAA